MAQWSHLLHRDGSRPLRKMMNGMELLDSEKVKCTSLSFVIGHKIWWESEELKYSVNEMTWAQFIDEFNDLFLNTNITRVY